MRCRPAGRKALQATVLALLVGCASLPQSEMETIIEQAWEDDPALMAQDADVPFAAGGRELQGAVRGVRALARQYGGGIGGRLADDAIQTTSKLAGDIGFQGDADTRRTLSEATADQFDVVNLEVLSEDKNGDGILAVVRYNLRARIDGHTEIIARQVTQAIQFAETQGKWGILRE